MINNEEKAIIRELAKQVRDLASLDLNNERIKRIREMHSLKPVRPPVWIDEIPWHEMDIDDELVLRCTDKEAQSMENYFRRILYRWKYIQADMVVEDVFYLNKAYTDSGIGINIKENIRSTSMTNNIVSHQYEDQLDTEEKVEALKIPIIEAQPDVDKIKLNTALEILDGIMPVKLRGYGIKYDPWDMIPQLRSVENIFMDMIDQPELIHKTIAKFIEIYNARCIQMETLGLLDYNLSAIHCTPAYTVDVPARDYIGGRVRLKDVWFRGKAQMFSSVSAAMWEEFEFQYTRGFMEKGAVVYYGCCEPLDKFIPYLKKVPNMRKIGVSPWADIRSSAEQIGGNYVFARKPNPAYVAKDLNNEVVEKEITETIKACIENKCPYEFVLKDISTVNFRPQNLIDWTNTVKKAIDRYYG